MSVRSLKRLTVRLVTANVQLETVPTDIVPMWPNDALLSHDKIRTPGCAVTAYQDARRSVGICPNLERTMLGNRITKRVDSTFQPPP